MSFSRSRCLLFSIFTCFSYRSSSHYVSLKTLSHLKLNFKNLWWFWLWWKKLYCICSILSKEDRVVNRDLSRFASLELPSLGPGVPLWWRFGGVKAVGYPPHTHSPQLRCCHPESIMEIKTSKGRERPNGFQFVSLLLNIDSIMKPQTKVISEKKHFTLLKANIFPKLLDYSHTQCIWREERDK